MLLDATGSTAGRIIWWWVGIGIGFAIVVIVVIVASTILALAGRIGQQAREGIQLMDEARFATVPVWEVHRTNALLTAIWRAAESARLTIQAKR